MCCVRGRSAGIVGKEVPAYAACQCNRALQPIAFKSICFAFTLLNGYSIADCEDFVLP